MTALAEKLKSAGVDTVGARLAVAVAEGLRRHPESVVDAWSYAGAVFGHEFTRNVMRDMAGSTKEPRSPPTPLCADNHPIVSAPYKPRQPRVVSLEALQKVRRAVSKYTDSAGKPWSTYTLAALVAAKRDGNEASALLAGLPVDLPNDGKELSEIMGVKWVDDVLRAAKREGQISGHRSISPA